MMTSPISIPPRKGVVFLGIALLFILSVAVFYRTVHFDFVNWDDDLYVYHNETIRSFSLENLKIWFTRPVVALYVPLPLASYALDYSLHGNDPSAYHLTNLLIHSLNGALVFLIFVLMTRNLPLSFLAALFFIIHPAQVETVCWISQRKNLLFGLFFLAGFLLRLYAFTRERRSGWFVLSTICFFLALGSKATAVVIPLVILAHEYFFRGARKREGLFLGLFLLVPAAAMGAFTLTLYPEILKKLTIDGVVSTYIQATTTLLIYVKAAFWPLDLSIHYDQIAHEALFMQGGILFYALIPVLGGLFLAAAKKREPAGFWFAWTAFFLLPVVNIFYVPAGDRHLYIPLIGLAGMWLFGFKEKRLLKAVVLAVVILLLMPVTVRRIGVWQNSETFWTNSSHKGAFSYTENMHLAGYYEDRKEFDKASELYWKVARQPSHLPYAYLNLYGILRMQGDVQGMADLGKLFNELYTASYALDEVYEHLVSQKSNPAEVRATLEMILNSSYFAVQSRERMKG